MLTAQVQSSLHPNTSGEMLLSSSKLKTPILRDRKESWDGKESWDNLTENSQALGLLIKKHQPLK